jgi:glutamyl-Q tRNA(Asp) synthetase
LHPASGKVESRPVLGRFAPTPSGPLHYGSIVAALGSFLDARQARGRWIVRIDDLDPPRVRPGAVASILGALARLGMHWDGEVLHQSSRAAAHAEALDRLRAAGLLYACACPRREVAGRAYPGTCRQRALEDTPGRSLRLRIPHDRIDIDDLFQGFCEIDVAAKVGDIIVRRADGLIAYHLASVIDDHWCGITHVVRGIDLLDASAAQCCVQQALGVGTPILGHLPLAVDESGRKLSKSRGSEEAMLDARPSALLFSALEFLAQDPPPELARLPVREVMDWAVANWTREKVPRVREKLAVR